MMFNVTTATRRADDLRPGNTVLFRDGHGIIRAEQVMRVESAPQDFPPTVPPTVIVRLTNAFRPRVESSFAFTVVTA